MGNSDSKTRTVVIENAAPIMISEALRARMSAGSAVNEHKSDAEHSPDDVRVVPTQAEDRHSGFYDPIDRMSLGEETALALLRMREERDRELARMQNDYAQKIRKAEDDFASISNIKEEEYTKALKETVEMFDKPRMLACPDMEKSVLDCYKANPTETLICSKIVAEFHDCVATRRVRDALEHKNSPARSG